MAAISEDKLKSFIKLPSGIISVADGNVLSFTDYIRDDSREKSQTEINDIFEAQLNSVVDEKDLQAVFGDDYKTPAAEA